jgi:Synergist-CTERM protein sorting domain-containing protein
VTAQNSAGKASKKLTLTVKAPVKPAIKTGSLPNGTFGKAYSASLSVTGTAPITYAASGLPSGLSINKSNGKITGTPKKVGTFTVKITAKNAAGSVTKSLKLKVVDVKPVIKTTNLKAGTVKAKYSMKLSATGTNIKWSWSGSKPAGLKLDAKTGTISGTPTKAGKFSFTVTAQNSAGKASKKLTLTINKATKAKTAEEEADTSTETDDISAAPGEEEPGNARLSAVIDGSVIEDDVVEVAAGTDVTFVIGDWSYDDGSAAAVTGMKVCVDDEPSEIEIEENRFTLPASVLENGEVEVRVEAEADGATLKSNGVFVSVEAASGEDDAAVAEEKAEAHSGCDTGLAGMWLLLLIPAMAMKRR